MGKLLVKLDHVATLREARRSRVPDPSLAAGLVEMAGANGVVVQLRSDRKHIKEKDLDALKLMVKTRLNIEVAPTQELLRLVRQVKPDRVILVAERPEEVTIDSGLDLVRNREMLSKEIPMLAESGIQIGLFIDPDVDQVKAAHKLDADIVYLNAARYCDARTEVDRYHQWNSILAAANAAHKLHLQVGLSQNLNYHDIRDFHGKEIDEFVVGFAILTRALMLGMDRAVREMVELIR